MHMLMQKDKVKAFAKILDLWKSNLQKNKIDMFPLLNSCTQVDVEANKKSVCGTLEWFVTSFFQLF